MQCDHLYCAISPTLILLQAVLHILIQFGVLMACIVQHCRFSVAKADEAKPMASQENSTTTGSQKPIKRKVTVFKCYTI